MIKKEEAKKLVQRFQKEISKKQYDLIAVTLQNDNDQSLWESFRDDILLPVGINLLEKLQTIPDNFFKGSTALTQIVIPANIKEIGVNAFKDCAALANVSFAENSQLEIIAEEAFCNCTSLTKISLPASITSIQKKAFEGCSSLEAIEFPSSLDHEVIIGYHGFGDEKGQKVSKATLEAYADKVINKIKSYNLADKTDEQKRIKGAEELKKADLYYIKPKIYIGSGTKYVDGGLIKTAGGGVIAIYKIEGKSEGAQYQGRYDWLDIVTASL